MEQIKKLNFPARLAKSFIQNKALSWLIIFFSVGMAIFAYIDSPKNYNPEIDIAAFNLQIAFPNSSPEEVDSFVAKEINTIVSNIPGIEKIETISYDGGMVNLFVKFKPGQNTDSIKAKFLTELQIVYAKLEHNNLPAMTMQSFGSKDLRFITFGLTSKTLNKQELREKAILLRDLAKENIEGLATPIIKGGDKKEVQINLHPQKMRIMNVDINTVINALNATNIRTQTGEIKNAENTIPVQIGGIISDINQLKNLDIGNGIYLYQVATISTTKENPDEYVKTFDPKKGIQDAVFLSFGKIKGKNVVTLAEETKVFIKEQLARNEFSGIDMKIYRDDSIQAKQSSSDLMVNLIQTILIVFIILLLFLQFRPAFIVTIAIPIIIGITLILGYFMGHDINSVYLAGFILGLGMLVDSATVTVEAIYRKKEEGMSPLDATLAGVHSVGNGLIISTITSVIVFFPLFILTGEMGEFQRPFAFVLPASLSASLFVSFTIAPFLTYLILKLPEKKKKEGGADGRENNNIFIKTIIFFNKKYKNTVEWLLEKKKRQYGFIFSLIALLVFSFYLMASGFVKQTSTMKVETTHFALYLDMPVNTSVKKTEEAIEKIAPKFFVDPRVKSVQIYSGTPMLGGLRGASTRKEPHKASIRIGTYAHSEAPEEALQKFPKDIVNTFREKFKTDPEIQKLRSSGIKIWMVEYPGGVPTNAPIEIQISGDNAQIRTTVLQDLFEIISKTSNYASAETTDTEREKIITYSINTDKAEKSGIKSSEIAQILSYSLQNKQVGFLHSSNLSEPTSITIQVNNDDKKKPEDLQKIFIKNRKQEMIPLSALLEFKYEEKINPIYRRDKKQMGRVTAYTSGDISQFTADIMKKVKEYKFPHNGSLVSSTPHSFSYKTEEGEIYAISFYGDFKQQFDVQKDFANAIIIALIAVYLVLVYQFKSLKAPLVIMSTIPLGFIGIFITFTLLWIFFGKYFDTGGLVGILALIGIVVNNSILILEAYDDFLKKGNDVKESLILACNQRFRPILLTSLTTSLGILTLLSNDMWQSLAIVIATGLLASVFITIFLIPILYNLMYGKK